MTNFIPEKIKYKFTFNPEKIDKVKEFVSNNANFNADSIKFEVKADKTTISFITNAEEELFKLHNFLLKIHEITGNKKEEEVEEPKIAITLKGAANKWAYFNYFLGQDFCKILKTKNIKFFVSGIKKNGFHYLDTCPIWVNEKDLDNVRKIVKESIYGKSFRIMIINLNITD